MNGMNEQMEEKERNKGRVGIYFHKCRGEEGRAEEREGQGKKYKTLLFLTSRKYRNWL